MTTIDDLPKELILHIASFLPDPHSCSKAIPNLAQSCKFLNACVHRLLFDSYSCERQNTIERNSPAFDILMENVRKYTVYVEDKDDLELFPNVNKLHISHSRCKFQPANVRRLYQSIIDHYAHLDSFTIVSFQLNLSCKQLLSALAQIFKINVLLSSFSVTIYDEKLESDDHLTELAEVFASVVSGLRHFRSLTVDADRKIQINSLVAVILNAFAGINSLTNVNLRFYSNTYSHTRSTIQKLLRSNPITSLRLSGMGIDHELTENITFCNYLTYLTLELVPSDVEFFFFLFRQKRLPRTTSLSIVLSTSDFDLRELDFVANFEGVENLLISTMVPLPACLYRDINRSSTLQRLDLSGDFWSNCANCSNFSDLLNSLEKLAMLNINLIPHGSIEDYNTLISTLASNQYIKELDLRVDFSSEILDEQITEILRRNSHLEVVSLWHYENRVELEPALEAILNNPDSSIETLSLTDIVYYEMEVKFTQDRNLLRRDGLVLMVRQFESFSESNAIYLLLKFIRNWSKHTGILFNRIELDGLPHLQYKALLTDLEIEELIRSDEAIKLGYKDGSLCLWYDNVM
ncbi:hypothetical protein HK098_006796 [Nowakowskiella sp. JEL0407]|nr:hypothetical protein HK098_006796 [Nowakowskiella sp. JEL0407]